MSYVHNIQQLKTDLPFSVAVATGKIPGWRSFRKFGMNDAVTSGTEYMWPPGTLRVLQTSASVASCVSSSAEDDENEATPPGTGAFGLVVEGLDENFVEVSETVALAGTTPVLTTQTFIRVDRCYITTAGSAETNIGNISISLGGALQAFVEIGEGQTNICMFTVPADHTVIVTNYRHGVGRMAGNVDLRILGEIRLNAGANGEGWRAISDIYDYQNHYVNDGSATVLPAKTDARMTIVSNATAQAYGIIGGYLVNNSYL